MGIRAPDWVRISLWLKASICRNRSFDEKDSRRKFLQVSTPKTKASRRTIPLTPKLKEILAEQKRQQAQSRILAGSEWQEHGLVFSTGLGTPLEGKNITRTLHRVLKEAGNEHLGVHALRHSYATMLNDAGVPIKTIQGIIGTPIYKQPPTAISTEGKKKAGSRPFSQPPACDLKYSSIEISGSKSYALCVFCA